MIRIITLDTDGNIIGNHDALEEEVTLPVVLCDKITLRPGWPPIGSPDFAERLRTWHAQHNPNPIGAAAGARRP